MTTYNGVGYPGELNLQGPNSVIPYLQNVGGTISNVLFSSMQAEEARIIGNNANNFWFEYLQTANNAKSLADFINGYRSFLYGKLSLTTPPSEQNYYASGGGITIYTDLRDAFAAQINLADWPTSNKADLLGTNPEAFPGSTIEDDLFFYSFTNFIRNYDASTASGANEALKFVSEYEKYTRNIVGVLTNSSPGVALNYLQIFSGFTGSSTIPPEIFASFVSKVINSEGFFNPSGSFDKWVDESVRLYVESYTGSPSQAVTSVGATSAKTSVLNRIFALLVDMIESLQRVTASQSNRLQIFTQWQTAYTALQGQIRYIIKNEKIDADGDGQVDDNISIGENDNTRNDYNAYTATLVETIKARKTAVGDDAKNLQTQVNQSNDAVNQQVSMATSILQELSTILSAIYK